MCTSLPLDPKKVKRWLLAASTNQTFHPSCFIGHCTHCTLYYLFIVLKCKCDPALLSPPLRAVGHLQQRAFCGVVPVALLRYMACRWLHPTSRLRLVNHLQPACLGGRRREGNQIWLQRRNPVVYWNKSSHGACCKRGDRCDTL